MNESSITSELKAYLERKLPGVWIKLADRATIGVPDATFTVFGITLWIEIKVISIGKKDVRILAKKIVESSTHGPLQLLTMRRLAAQGHAIYAVYAQQGKLWWTCLIPPEALHRTYMEPESHGFGLVESLQGRNHQDVENLIRRLAKK